MLSVCRSAVEIRIGTRWPCWLTIWAVALTTGRPVVVIVRRTAQLLSQTLARNTSQQGLLSLYTLANPPPHGKNRCRHEQQ